MPEYLFLNKETGEEWKEWMTISERDKFVEENPHIEQLVLGFPGHHSGRGMKKPDGGFRDVLKTIKSKHRGAKINTF